MSAGVTFDASALRQVVREFEKRGGDVSKIMRHTSEILVSAVNDVFEAQGPGWPALAPATITARRGGGAGARMLIDSGNLVGSITRAWAAHEAEAYTEVPYAGFHVSGTSRMPARDFMAVNWDEVMDEVHRLALLQLVPP